MPLFFNPQIKILINLIYKHNSFYGPSRDRVDYHGKGSYATHWYYVIPDPGSFHHFFRVVKNPGLSPESVAIILRVIAVRVKLSIVYFLPNVVPNKETQDSQLGLLQAPF